MALIRGGGWMCVRVGRKISVVSCKIIPITMGTNGDGKKIFFSNKTIFFKKKTKKKTKKKKA